MRAILPGRPQSTRQAISTAHWDDLRLIAYISGNAVIIATGPNELLQTIYIDTESSLHAVTIEESSGQLAVCGDKNVYVYNPIGRDEGVLSWVQRQHHQSQKDELVTSLSWASPEELMIGGSTLLLWYNDDVPRVIWEQKIAYPTAMAYFSHDGALLASCGQHDRVVKIWRRLSYEVDSTRFDVSYLPHPASVTNLHWRKPWHSEMNLDNLLYSFCADNRIRVWAYGDPHSVRMLQMIAEIDMTATIQPRRLSVGSMSRRRYAFIIDSRDFAGATEIAVQKSSSQTDHALEHLIEVARRSPEVCVVLDGLGHMSVWGLENAGFRNKEPTEVFNIAHVDDVNISIIQGAPEMQDYTQFCIFSSNGAALSVLAHSFDGSISWYEAHISHFFDTAPRKDRVRQIASWGGHHHPVNGMTRNESGDLLCSWSDEEVIIWRLTRSQVLQKIYAVKCKKVQDALFFGDDLRVLDSNKLLRFGDLLNDKKGSKEQGATDLAATEQPTPELLMDCAGTSGVIRGDGSIVIPRTRKSLSTSSIPGRIIPCSYSGWLTAVAVTPEGGIQGLKCLGDDFTQLGNGIETTVRESALISAVPSGKIALTDESRLQLSIWDLRLGTCEFVSTVTETIETLHWHQTANGTPMLAVCFAFHVTIMGQSRFTEFQKNAAWVKLRDIRIRDFTGHAIGAVCCLDDGSLVIGAGNQLFVLDSVTSRRTKQSPSAPAGLELANATLPVYHPEIVNLVLSQGDHTLANEIVMVLHEKLKYFSEGDQLESMLDLRIDQLTLKSKDRTGHKGQPNGVNGVHANGQTSLQDIAERLKANAQRQEISHLSSAARHVLSHTIDVAKEVEPYRLSLDENAQRYLHGLYYYGAEVDLPWRAIVFASLSTSQEPLIDLVTRFYGGKLTWEAARRSGLFIWLSDVDAIKIQMENVGRAEYTKHEDRNPVDCSLYYLALGKKSVLQGLWRQSVGVGERANTMKLLTNNFKESKWRSTALKNAYALMSKRRFEYAAAFFLLGGSLKDAVNVCVGQVKDLQLAVAIARVYESPDQEAVLADLLEKHVIVAALQSDQGRWMASWAYMTLDQKEKALQVLVRPVHQVTGSDLSTAEGIPASLNWKINDPLLAVLYVQLRAGLTKKNAWHAILTPGEERDFVLRCARFYVRMGADFLAMRLLRDWNFVEESKEVRTLPIRRGSLVDEKRAQVIVDVQEAPEEKKKEKKPPPTQFVEPSADSLLDSFGF